MSFIISIFVLVFVHELGHFLVAKWCGVGVIRFSVGFGPALLKFRIGETLYQLCIIPLGGYVRMVGDMPDPITGDEETDDEVRKETGLSEKDLEVMQDRSRWFIEKSYWARFAIVFAGPLFNFLLAIGLIFLTVMIYGSVEPEPRAIIGEVMDESPAQMAGVKKGDLISTVNDTVVSTWSEVAELIHNSEGKAVELLITRDSSSEILTITPEKQELALASGGKKSVYLVGIKPSLIYSDASFMEALEIGLRWTGNITAMTYSGLWGMITGKISAKELAGPLFIYQATSQKAKRGLEDLLSFIALLSVSLAVINLLPVPVLDGGHLFFFTYEAIFGEINMRAKEIAQNIGVVALLGLMGFAVVNDLLRDRSKLLSGFKWKDSEKSAKENPGEAEETSQAVGSEPVVAQ